MLCLLNLLLLFPEVILGRQHEATNYYCCDFSNSSQCDWKKTGDEFTWSGDLKPTNNNVTGKDNYEWLEMYPSQAYMTSQEVTIDENDVIFISLYRTTASFTTVTKLNFLRTDNFYSVTLISSLKLDWADESVTCGTIIPCCATYPCAGRFVVEGSLGSDGETIAFTDFKINDCSAPVYPTSFCNRLESPTDGWTTDNWHLTGDSYPDWSKASQFQHTSNYAWSQNYDGGRLSSIAVTLNQDDRFSFDYYVESSVTDIENSLIFYFNDSDSKALYPLSLYQNTKSNWINFKGQCTKSIPCCKTYPCRGQFVWEGSLNSGNVLLAIDNLEMNGECVSTPSCCGFENQQICGMTSDPVDQWIWSGSSLPTVVNVTTSDGDYMWLEGSSSTIKPSTSTLSTDFITLYPNSTISVNILTQLESSGTLLKVDFFPDEQTEPINLEYVTMNYADWYSLSVPCKSPNSDCCDNSNGCKGKVEIIAVSSGNQKSFFAIDDFEIDKTCSQ